MKVHKVHEITLDIEETIITASLLNADECIMLMSSGNVIRYKISEQNKEDLFSTKGVFVYSDGGFDITAPSTIYTLDSIVVIVNDYKRHGFIYCPEKYYLIDLSREDYYAGISCYPIALFKNESGVHHIIYGRAWNHVQIMNLDTRQVLTASKSLIEENAEEDHIKFYKNHEEANKLPWPRPYDYFFGKLHMSPDQKRFLSAGWIWGSFDACNVYDIEHFTNDNRIKAISVGGWEHCVRSICWIDNSTVAVPYNPFAEGDDDSNKDSPCEILLYKVGEEKSELERVIKITDVDIANATICFNEQLNAMVAFSHKTGLAVISLDGDIKFQDKDLKVDSYYPDVNLLLKVENKTIMVYEIIT